MSSAFAAVVCAFSQADHLGRRIMLVIIRQAA